MHLSEKSQSIIEYSVVIILVAAGIILGGPYVIRGVNAHFKLWEDAVNDSLKEKIKEAPSSEVPPQNCGDCSRRFWINPGCCIQCGDTCGNGFCCSERGENRPESPNFCKADCGGSSCAGITDAVCHARSPANCCSDSCCSNCNDGNGDSMGCFTWKGGCNATCAQCLNDLCEPGENFSNCCQDCYGCGDRGCCINSENRQNCCDCCANGVCPPEGSFDCNGDGHCDPLCGETYERCGTADCPAPPPPACGTYHDPTSCMNHCGNDCVWIWWAGDEPGYGMDNGCCREDVGYPCGQENPGDCNWGHTDEALFEQCCHYNPHDGGPGGNPCSCFVGGTLITMADGSKVPIEQISKGDRVLSFDSGTKKLSANTVVKTFKHDARGYLIINDRLKVTDEHPILSKGRWAKAGELKEGDFLFNAAEGKDEKILSIVPASEQAAVYNLEVDGVHAYIAQGYAVHNKQGCDPSTCGNGVCDASEGYGDPELPGQCCCPQDCGSCTLGGGCYNLP